MLGRSRTALRGAARCRGMVGRGLSSAAGEERSPASYPMSVPIPGIPALRPRERLPTPRTEVSTLANGLRVASQETYGQVSSISLFLEAGTMHEPEGKHGVCHLLENTLFRETAKMTMEDIQYKCQQLGISASVGVLRDSLMIRVDVLRGNVESAFDLLGEAVLDAKFAPAVIEDAKVTLQHQIMDLMERPEELVQEVLQEAAYGEDSPLGHGPIRSMDSAMKISAQEVSDFLNDRLRPSRMTLSAAGVEHASLVKEAERIFGSIPADFPNPPSPSTMEGNSKLAYPAGSPPVKSRKEAMDRISQFPRQWKGGLSVRPYSPPTGFQGPELSHMAVAFPTVGWVHRDVVPITVLDTLLGGGASFSAGGPGKGMYTRLYTDVLVKCPFVEACNAFSLQFCNEGYWGMYGATSAHHFPTLANVITEHLHRLITTLPTEEELSRAKNQLLSSVMMNLELRSVLSEDIGRQVLVMGERISTEELKERINAVTRDDIRRICAHSMLDTPAMAVLQSPHVSESVAEDAYGAMISAIVDSAKKVV